MKAINRISLLILMFGIVVNISAQDFYANNHGKIENETDKAIIKNSKIEERTDNVYKWEFDSLTPSIFDNNIIQKAEEHEFGSTVACLKVLIDKYYVTQEEVVPGDPMKRTIIKKPNIYNTVRKIEKHLKKEVKTGDINLQKATSDFTHVLEVCLAIIDNTDTKTFEDTLDKGKKNIDDQISIFNQVKINSIY